MRQPLLVYLVADDIWITADTYTDQEYRITVPANYETNLASIPRCLWSIIAPFELSEVAPLVHDYLYDHAGIPVEICGETRIVKKREADKIFRRIMKREGVPGWKRFAGYWAVRLFASGAWKTCKNRNERAS